jgi:hypothetical protein
VPALLSKGLSRTVTGAPPDPCCCRAWDTVGGNGQKSMFERTLRAGSPLLLGSVEPVAFEVAQGIEFQVFRETGEEAATRFCAGVLALWAGGAGSGRRCRRSGSRGSCG